MALETAVGVFTLPTGTGTADFDIAGFGTPKLAEFYACYATVDGTIVAHAGLGYGCADGTNQWTVCGQSEDAVGRSDCDRASNNGFCLRLLNVGADTANGHISWNSWTANGVRVDIDNSFSTAFKVVVVLTRGDDINVAIGQLTVATTTESDASVTGLGFEPDYVKMCTIGDDAINFNNTRWMVSYGVAVNDGSQSQWCHMLREGNNLDPTQLAATLYNNRVVGSYLAGSTTVDWTAQFKSFDVGGFTVTTKDSDAPAGTDTFYLAVECPTNSLYAGTMTTPTSTGTDPITGFGFQPKYVQLQMGRMEAVNTAYTSPSASVIGMGLIDGSNDGTVCVSAQDNVNTTVTASVTDSQAVRCLAHDGLINQEATLSSFDSNGFTLNWSNIDTTARVWGVFAIENESVVGGAQPIGAFINRNRIANSLITR